MLKLPQPPNSDLVLIFRELNEKLYHSASAALETARKNLKNITGHNGCQLLLISAIFSNSKQLTQFCAAEEKVTFYHDCETFSQSISCSVLRC